MRNEWTSRGFGVHLKILIFFLFVCLFVSVGKEAFRCLVERLWLLLFRWCSDSTFFCMCSAVQCSTHGRILLVIETKSFSRVCGLTYCTSTISKILDDLPESPLPPASGHTQVTCWSMRYWVYPLAIASSHVSIAPHTHTIVCVCLLLVWMVNHLGKYMHTHTHKWTVPCGNKKKKKKKFGSLLTAVAACGCVC